MYIILAWELLVAAEEDALNRDWWNNVTNKYITEHPWCSLYY